jgi:8-oxo-dGTP pyrophosphatase MutT (NUDIX family)
MRELKLCDLTLELKARLVAPLPGTEAQYQMAPEGRRTYPVLPDRDFIHGAVMILLCEDTKGSIFFPLILRHQYDGPHSGQVSLPGGKSDKTDVDAETTAMRECYEEIGIKGISVIGRLSPLYIPVSGFFIDVIVGACNEIDPLMVSHEREVASILKFQITDLLTKEMKHAGVIETGQGIRVKAPWYELDGQRVWGATAMIISEFTSVLQEVYGTR